MAVSIHVHAHAFVSKLCRVQSPPPPSPVFLDNDIHAYILWLMIFMLTSIHSMAKRILPLMLEARLRLP